MKKRFGRVKKCLLEVSFFGCAATLYNNTFVCLFDFLFFVDKVIGQTHKYNKNKLNKYFWYLD